MLRTKKKLQLFSGNYIIQITKKKGENKMYKKKEYVRRLIEVYNLGKDMEEKYYYQQEEDEDFEDIFMEEVLCMQGHIEVALNILKKLV